MAIGAVTMMQKLKGFLPEAVFHCRCQQLNEIARTYPISTPALYDLKDTMTSRELKRSDTVLHPASKTEDVIHMFINGCKCIKMLGVDTEIQGEFEEKVKGYLKTRWDLAGCIIDAVYNENHSTKTFHPL
ncbi:hypothetical protein BC829DRAFT_303513 [Chytridium lagenaria]|nr:hypothetical protein BC829DRAFT_303513 [Chytridium lagenaria]